MFTTMLAMAAAAAPVAAVDDQGPPVVVERVAVLMRHGVRPPTKTPPMPDGTAGEPWPSWPVAPGELTPHGAEAIRLVARADRVAWAGLVGASGCPEPGSVALSSDSDQRTIATGDVWAEAFAPGCRIPNAHKPQGVADPNFASIESGLTDYDPQLAEAAVKRALPPGGLAAVEAGQAKALARLDTILCGKPVSGCGITRKPTGLTPPKARTRPKLTGALDRASTAAQILLLEYADGKPSADVGWGRAEADDIATLGRLHALEFALVARPTYIAARNVAPIASALRDALSGQRAAKVTMIVGHDTNFGNLGGLIDVHWQARGYAADDPAPGGALILERVRDAGGARFVRVRYRVQPLDALRTLRPDIQTITLHMPGCDPRGDGLCPLDAFVQVLDRSVTLLKQSGTQVQN